MSVSLKSAREIEIMREAGRIVGNVLQELRETVRPGITTKELDRIARDGILRQGAEPAFPHINDFPGSLCISVNEEVVHGIPGPRKLRSGDLVKMDAGAIYKGYHGDAAVTVGVGEVSPDAQRLMEVTERSLALGIEAAQPGAHLNDIGTAIEEYIVPFGFSAVRQYAGHGIGRELHEDPSVAHYRQSSRGMKLRAGMVLTIEPMINAGTWDTVTLRDGWTVVTRDRRLSAQFEHTIAITDDGPKVLTLPEHGEAWGVPFEMAKQVH
jgi:methionyl aminopeptidase